MPPQAHLHLLMRSSAGSTLSARGARLVLICRARSGSMAAPEKVPSTTNIIDFLELLQNLKTTPRTGWVHHNVQKPESIADHMYRMSALSLLLQGSEYSYERCIKMSIVHDMAEALVGDIAPCDNISDADKHEREAAAIERIKTMVGAETAAANEIEELWWEYENCGSKEAALVKDFDKLEMILQASEYERAQGLSLQDFFDSTENKWKTEIGKNLAEEVVRRRTKAQEKGNEAALERQG